ncbi:hypothetical protein [Streptomyces sp. NPDC058326]|uniref:hypothetical protein n=1 Tax=Streptomyces sp. NPDC058326 TaxID=3346447 RepID=UPI0036EE60BB
MGNVQRAAWVPDDDPERDWELAAQLAVAWIQQECDEQDAGGVLVLNAFGAQDHSPALRRFSALHACTTPRADRSRVGCGIGPVLVYAPTEKTLDFAMSLARGSSIAVIEGTLFPLRGWAQQLGAIDLTRPNDEPEQIPPRLVEAIERLDFYGNNGFGDQFGKQQAGNILRDLRDAGILDREFILGAMAARGASDRSIKNLSKIVDRLNL